MRRRGPTLATTLIAATALAGCAFFDTQEPEPVTTPISTDAPADADLLCGMDRQSVEVAVGYEIDRVEGDLEDEEGCRLWPVEGTVHRDWVLSVRSLESTSDSGTSWRGAIDGTAAGEGIREPDVRYEDVVGGAWRFERGSEEATNRAGAWSVVFAGDRAVSLVSVTSPEGRDAAVDLWALAHQVAASAGLTLEQPSG